MPVDEYLKLSKQAKRIADTRKNTLRQALNDAELTTKTGDGEVDLTKLEDDSVRDQFEKRFFATLDNEAFKAVNGNPTGADIFARNGAYSIAFGMTVNSLHEYMEESRGSFDSDQFLYDAVNRGISQHDMGLRRTLQNNVLSAPMSVLKQSDVDEVKELLAGNTSNRPAMGKINWDVVGKDTKYMAELLNMNETNGQIVPKAIEKQPYYKA